MPYSFLLKEIIETKKYPHARTLRTSFSQKMQDAYELLQGETPLEEMIQRNVAFIAHPHAGIFDYVTLFIPLGLIYFTQWVGSKGIVPAILFAFPLSLINYALHIVRGLFSAILTLASLPLIALIQGCSHLIANQMHKDVLSLEGMQNDGVKQNLEKFLINNHLGLDLDEKELDVKVERDEAGYKLIFSKPHMPVFFNVPFKDGQDIQINKIKSVFKLNVGKVTSNAEQGKGLGGCGFKCG